MTAPDEGYAVELRELDELFELMWTDAISLLTILREGVFNFAHSAYLNFLAAIAVIIIDGALIASGFFTLSSVVSLLAATGLLILSALMFLVAVKSWRRFSFLKRTYSKMICAAKEFKEVQARDAKFKESWDSRRFGILGRSTSYDREKKERES